MNKPKIYLILIFLGGLFCSYKPVAAQNDVMMQGFNFNVPVDAANHNGTRRDNLAGNRRI